MPTIIHHWVAECRQGRYPGMIARMTAGWAIMGHAQFLPGYCLLLSDPVVPHLNALQAAQREQFLCDMARLGDAVLASAHAVRINYALFGNLEPALHAHVVPRYADEPESLRTAHPWSYDWNAAPQFSVQTHGSLLQALRAQLQVV